VILYQSGETQIWYYIIFAGAFQLGLKSILSTVTSLRCNTTLLYRKAKMLFGPYFHEKTGSLLCTPLHKVTKPPESLKNGAKYVKVCFLRQGLIPGLLRGSQTTMAQIRIEQDGRKMNLNLIYFLCTSPTYPSHCVRWPWNSNEILKGWSIFRSEKLDDHGILMKL
jgi:hypothetical protein